MRPSRKLALAALAAVVAVAVLRGLGGDGATEGQDKPPALLIDRAWVDSKPERYTDYVQAAYFSSGSPIGVFQKASAYDFRVELFNYKRTDNNVAFTFPQTGKTAGLKFTIRGCSELPPFDLCLDVSENPWGGPKRYYGMLDQSDEASQVGSARRALKARAEGR